MRKIKQLLFCFLILGLVTVFFINSQAFAQYWEAMPPYNLLWPLWSETLSPPDSVTNTPTPIITQLSPTTVLPIEPVWAWNIDLDSPFFYFNGPDGLWLFNNLIGLAPFPPNLTPITLPAGYPYLVPPFDIFDFATWATQANLVYTLTASAVFDPLYRLYPLFPYPLIPYAELLQPFTLWVPEPW